jgi:hypothetical protein
MWDYSGDGWDTTGAIRVNVNATDLTTTKITSGNGPAYYIFYVVPNDVVTLYWISGQSQAENAFAVYYGDDPPATPFIPTSGATVPAKILFSQRYSTMNSIANGATLGTFTVP